MRLLVLAAVVLAGCASGPRPSGLLFLAGREPGTLIRVDVAAGTAVERRLPQLSGGDPPYMVAFTGGRVVTFSLGRTSSLAPGLSDPRSLGEAWFFVPSATPGRVWNILRKRGSNVKFRGVREVTVDGRVTARRDAAVPGWPVGAVDAGIVVQRRVLAVWDPVRARVVRRLPADFPVAFHGALAASCADPCRAVHLTDTATGRDRAVPGRFAVPYEGAFSPDGRRLALPAAGGRVALIDVAAGTATLVPGARMSGEYKLLAWGSSGWLFYSVGAGRLGAWRSGAPARRLGVRVGTFVDMAAD
jgi:hypothetical protein